MNFLRRKAPLSPSNSFPLPYYHHHFWVPIACACWVCGDYTQTGQHASRLFLCQWLFTSSWIKSHLLLGHFDTLQHGSSLMANYFLSATWHSRSFHTIHMHVCICVSRAPVWAQVISSDWNRPIIFKINAPSPLESRPNSFHHPSQRESFFYDILYRFISLIYFLCSTTVTCVYSPHPTRL